MTDIVERLRAIGTSLGNTVAGYRDNDNKRAARGAVDIARMTQEAANEIARLHKDKLAWQNVAATYHAEIEKLRNLLTSIQKHPDVPLLIKSVIGNELEKKT